MKRAVSDLTSTRTASGAYQSIWTELDGGLWHSTHPERFLSILEHGAIVPEPKIHDRDRWKTSSGKEFYPYVRYIGGVSLFDFHQFDPKSYESAYPLSNWYAFVPYVKRSNGAVWIEINRERISGSLLSGCDLLSKWKSDHAYKHAIMPLIEAAHFGPLPRSAFKRALFIGVGDDQFHEFEIKNFDRVVYDVLLGEWHSRCNEK